MPPYTEIMDGSILIGLLGFPLYSIYWIRYHLRGERWRRLWVLVLALLIWLATTYFCFLRLMIGCMGGGCDYRISPFLEYSIAYAVSSIVLIAVMHAFRAKHVA